MPPVVWISPWWRIAEDQIPFRGLIKLSSPREPTEALSGSSSSIVCSDFNEPKTEARFFCNDFLRGRGVSKLGVDADIAADQAATSAFADPGRRRTFGLGLWDRPKKPELRRAFLSRDRISSEGVRTCRIGWGSGAELVDDGLNRLRLFLRSFLPLLSAMANSRYG